jgi:ABC-2 type transport system ATP-binding protein
MSQRLGIAAAILSKPKYLILDEPANGLDPEGIVWMREFLKAYADDGNGVFVSSHLLSEMAQLVDNVIVIGKGKLIASTSIKGLLSDNTKSSVFVRSNNISKLETILKAKKYQTENLKNGLEVYGVKTDEIGKLAYQSDLTIYELVTQNASLEDVFLELTEGKEEFQARTPKVGKS